LAGIKAGDVIVKIEGISVFTSDVDIFSHPDPSGLRWVSMNRAKKIKFWREAALNPIIKKMQEFNQDINPKAVIEMPEYFNEKFKKLLKKEQVEIINLYKKHMSKLLTHDMYKKIFFDNLGTTSTTKYDHNELLVNRYKVIGVYAIQNGQFANKNQDDEDFMRNEISKYCKCPYLGFIPRKDFSKVNPQTY